MFRQPFEPVQSPGGNIRFRQSSASCGTVTVREQDTGGGNGGDTGGDTGGGQPGDGSMGGALDDLLPFAGGLGVLVVAVAAYYALRD